MDAVSYHALSNLGSSHDVLSLARSVLHVSGCCLLSYEVVARRAAWLAQSRISMLNCHKWVHENGSVAAVTSHEMVTPDVYPVGHQVVDVRVPDASLVSVKADVGLTV